MFNNLRSNYEHYKQEQEDRIEILYTDEKISMNRYIEKINEILSFEEFLDESIERAVY